MNEQNKLFILRIQESCVSNFQRYLSTKLRGSKKHFYEICYYYIIDYTFLQPQLFNDKG